MQNKRLLVYSALMVIIGAVLAVALFNYPIEKNSGTVSDSILNYNAYVCTYKNKWLGDHYGESELVGCSHNVLYDNGKNLTRDLLGYGGPITANISTISLCNASTGSACGTPAAAGSEAFTAYTSCGLQNATGVYNTILPNGNWTITKTFTSSCDNRVTNATRLVNASGSIFAGNNFATVTLQNLDTLTVNWTIMIS